MAHGLLGKKLGMTHLFDTEGRMVPVTLILAGPCYVLQVKTTESDGYNALQLGFEARGEKNATKPELGLIEKVNQLLKDNPGDGSDGEESGGKSKRGAAPKITPMRYIRELRIPDPENYHVGQRVDVNGFEVGEKVDVIGTSKGRGFAGSIKRHGTSRGPESHGSRYHRRPGSMGPSAYPSRVFKGKKLPGHMGNHRTTTTNLTVMQTDEENHLIAVKGSVPGHINGFVIIRKNARSRKG